MSKARQDFIVDSRQGLTLRFTVANAALMSVDGITWRLSLTSDGEAEVEKTVGSGIAVVDDENIDVTLDDGDLTEPGLYYHVLFQTIADDDRMLSRGRAFVRPLPSTPSS